MKSIFELLCRSKGLLPRRMITLARRWISFTEWDLRRAEANDPYRDLKEDRTNDYGSPYTFGVIREFLNFHIPYVAALREMKIPYKILDISKSNWLEVIESSSCNIFLVWPSAYSSLWNWMYDDRVKIMVDELGARVYPSPKELWLYENKRRQRDFLDAHKIPHPTTWVFYHLRDLMAFVDSCSLPIVYKTNLGATTAGVRIFRERHRLRSFVRRAFTRGKVPRRLDSRDKQWGYVLLQEYLPQVKEWRMVRIGDSFFGYRKLPRGDFHSGSHAWAWDTPSHQLLDLLRDVTEIGEFTSMDVDIFETRDGRLLVNELQTVFGAAHPADMLRVEGTPGRLVYKSGSATGWVFEPGDFSRNSCANERVEYLIRTRYAG